MESLGRLVMILVLDTNALWNQELMREIAAAQAADRSSIDPILPALAYAERRRQVSADEDKLAAFDAILERVQPTIEPFTRSEGDRVAQQSPTRDEWEEHARDVLIAAHIHGERIGISDDQGPAWRTKRTLTPEQGAQLLRTIPP